MSKVFEITKCGPCPYYRDIPFTSWGRCVKLDGAQTTAEDLPSWCQLPDSKGEWHPIETVIPAMGQTVILSINGIVQKETYTLDADDTSDYAPLGCFWTREGLDEGLPVFLGQEWTPLPAPPKEKK